MSNIIIGTAGHIDHGKTTLIKRLSNIDTDRLKEEKKRGITIELGFAYFDLPSGKRAGIVDVPGHEKFIKNMLAGASGIDMVILVISAEEGIMPQTKEHLDILNLLGIQNGIIALTKCDLVDKEWKDLVKLDIMSAMEGTFLEDAPIVDVAMGDDASLEILKNELDKVADTVIEKSSSGLARLPIDRVFTLTGFGTVVTGTLVEGKINVGDVLSLYPDEKEARVRNIQVHGKDVKTAISGQRVAVNIANLKKTDINRGDVLAEPQSMRSTYIVDCSLKLLESSTRIISNWSRLRVYHGSKELLARVVLLDKEELKPGESCFAQLRLEEKTSLKYDDKFVVRFYSPLETIGGGIILDPVAVKHKRFKDEIIDELNKKYSGDDVTIVEDIILKNSGMLPDINKVIELSGFDEVTVNEALKKLISEQSVIVILSKIYVHLDFLRDKNEELLRLLGKFYDKNPYKLGFTKEEVKKKLFSGVKSKEFEELLSLLISIGDVDEKQGIVSIKGKELNYSARDKKIIEKLLSKYDDMGIAAQNLFEVLSELGISKSDMHLVESLYDASKLVRINETFTISKEAYDEAYDLLMKHFKANDSIKLSDYRDITGTSRKIAVGLLDYFDKVGITRRVEDVRVLVK